MIDLIIWSRTGETYRFENVTNFKDDNGKISFSYFGISTQTTRSAVFYNFSGYALKEVGK